MNANKKIIENDLDMYQFLFDTLVFQLDTIEDEEKKIKEHSSEKDQFFKKLIEPYKNIKNSKFNKINTDLKIYEEEIYNVMKKKENGGAKFFNNDETANLIQANAKIDVPNIQFIYLINKYPNFQACKSDIGLEELNELKLYLRGNIGKADDGFYIPDAIYNNWYKNEKARINNLKKVQNDIMAPIVNCLAHMIYYKNDISNKDIKNSVDKAKQALLKVNKHEKTILEHFNDFNFNLIKNVEKIIENYEQIEQKEVELKTKLNNAQRNTHDVRMYNNLAELYKGEKETINEYRENKLKALFMEAKQNIIKEFIAIRQSKVKMDWPIFEKKYKELSNKYKEEVLKKIENDDNYMLDCDKKEKDNLLKECMKDLKNNDFFDNIRGREAFYSRFFVRDYEKGFIARVKQKKKEVGMSLGR